MKKEKTKEIILTGKDEMNLSEFPFTVLSHKIAKSKKTIKWTSLVPGKNGKLINQEWIVSGNSEYGLPHAIDNDFYLGVMLFLKRNNFEGRTIHFREYEFLRAIGKDNSKRNYKELQQAFARMKGVSIYATNAFWDNKERCYLKSVGAFGVIDNYWLFSEEKEKEDYDRSKIPYSSVTINEVLFQSIQSSYIKTIDLDFYFSLKTPLTKRLFRYLDKNRYKKEIYEIELLKLACLLPLEDKKTYAIKRRLENPHKELTEKYFLEKVKYGKTQTGKHKATYTFTKTKSLEPEQTEILLEIPESSISQKIRALTEREITEITAHELVEKYPNRIAKHIDIFDYLIEKKDPKVSKNPAGFLCKSIEKDFASPKNYISKEQRIKIKEQQNKEQQEHEKQRKYDEAFKQLNKNIKIFLETLPREERTTLEQKILETIPNERRTFKPYVDSVMFELIKEEHFKKDVEHLTKLKIEVDKE